MWARLRELNPGVHVRFTQPRPHIFLCLCSIAKNIPARLREWMAEMLRHKTFCCWITEHSECGSRKLCLFGHPCSMRAGKLFVLAIKIGVE